MRGRLRRARKFDLLAISQGAAVAIAYAVRHPERVRKLVICNGYAAGWAVRGDPDERARREAMLTLTEIGWGADNPAYRQLFTNLYIPDAHAQADGLVQRNAAGRPRPRMRSGCSARLSQIDVRSCCRRSRRRR